MSVKSYTLTREQVREICPSCADKMQLARIKSLKLSADELGNLLPDDETTIKLFAGFSQGLCNKFDAETKGFFTRCAAKMAGKVEDEKGFCASLEKYCTGNWPAENAAKKHVDDADYQEYIDKREDVSPKEGKQRYGDVTFADAKNKKYPIDTEEHIRAAWNYIHKGKNADKYSPEDLATVKSRIVSAWKKTIDKAGPPSAEEQKNNDQIKEFGDFEGHPFHGNQWTAHLDSASKALDEAGLSGMSKLLNSKGNLNSHLADIHERLNATGGSYFRVPKYDVARSAVAKAISKQNGNVLVVTPGQSKSFGYAVIGLKNMTRQEVAAKCPDCAGKMAGNSQDMPVDNGGHMQHICGKGGRAIANMSEEDEAHKFEVAEYVNNIKGVEIFKTGVHNGDTYTEKDLDDMVSAFGVLDYRPAIKIGHTKDAPGSPAYGWVQNITRDGDKLRADFTDMHDSVVEAIRNKSYDRCSSEIYFNLKRGGKDYRRALKAVALLGAEVPAVANLIPLHKMEFAAEGFERIGVHEQALDIPSQAMVDALAERVAELVTLIKEHDMSKNAEKIAELKDRVDELNEQIVALNAAGHKVVPAGDKFNLMGPDGKMVSTHASMAAAVAAKKDAEDALDQGVDEAKENQVKELTQQAADLETEIHALEIAKDTVGEIAKLNQRLADSEAREKAAKQETKELSQRMARIESERRNAEVGAKVEACKIPAFRDSLKAIYAYAVEHADAVVKIYSKDKDGKDTSADKTLVETIDGVVSEINAQSEKLFKALAFSGQTVRVDGVIEGDAGAEVQSRVKAYRVKHPEVKQYEQAMTAVLQEDEALAARYRAEMGREQ